MVGLPPFPRLVLRLTHCKVCQEERYARLASSRVASAHVFSTSQRCAAAVVSQPAAAFNFFTFNTSNIESTKQMILARINTIPTSQDAPMHIWHHTGHAHAAGKGSVTVTVKLPAGRSYPEGFPSKYAVSVTPSQLCAVSVNNQTATSFDVTLTALNGGNLSAGTLSALVIG
jgi:hypothetical protein